MAGMDLILKTLEIYIQTLTIGGLGVVGRRRL